MPWFQAGPAMATRAVSFIGIFFLMAGRHHDDNAASRFYVSLMHYIREKDVLLTGSCFSVT
jgi:hypothetical protein